MSGTVNQGIGGNGDGGAELDISSGAVTGVGYSADTDERRVVAPRAHFSSLLMNVCRSG